MYTVTFYSYKGGVGRTSALMNVAYRLAKFGRKVFILDFDLEAPGIDSFQIAQSDGPRQGVVEYISHFMDSGEIAQLSDFVYDISPTDIHGRLLLMPAGRKDEDYQTSLSRLDWKVFYKQKSGFLFVENLRSAIKQQFTPDYIFIDSRTGLTDISGICTLQLPDLVVLLFSLNEQNINGTSQIYRTIKFNKLNRPIETILVASPIPDISESIGIRKQRFEHARRKIGASVDVILPYDPFVAFQETITEGKQFQDLITQSLARGYDVLTERIFLNNSQDILTLLNNARRFKDSGDIELAELKYQEIAEAHPDNVDAWLELGSFLRLTAQSEKAIHALQRAVEIAPGFARAWAQLTTAELAAGQNDNALKHLERLLNLSTDTEEIIETAGAFELRGHLDAALKAYEKAVRLSTNADTLFSLGQALMALKRYEGAFKAYEKVMQDEPSKLPAVFNTAFAASNLGKPESEALFVRAVDLFERSDHLRSPRDLANMNSAIAFAYDFVGKQEKAIKLLREALVIAEGLDRGPIFLFPAYKYVDKEQFIEVTRMRLKELEAKLPTESRPASPVLGSLELRRVPTGYHLTIIAPPENKFTWIMNSELELIGLLAKTKLPEMLISKMMISVKTRGEYRVGNIDVGPLIAERQVSIKNPINKLPSS